MVGGLKSKIKSIVIYFFGNVMSQAVVFILLPIYTAYLSPEEYGYFDLIRTYSTFIINFLYLQLHTIVLRYLYEYPKQVAVSNTLFLTFFSTISTSFAVMILAMFTEVEYLSLVILYSITTALSNYYSYVARGCGRNVLFAVSGFIATVVNVAVNLILIIGFDFGYVALYIASISSCILQCLIIEVAEKVIFTFKSKLCKKDIIIDMLKFGVPFAINMSAYWFLTSYSRTVISDSLGTYYNGIYAVATKFTTILNLLSTCVLMVWQEMSFAQYEAIKNDKKKIGVYYTNSNTVVMPLFILLTALLLPMIKIVYPFVIDVSYSEGLYIIPLAIIGMMLNIYCSYLTSIFTAIKRNTMMLVSSIGGALFNVVFANLLVNSLKVDGVNLALIVGFIVNTVIRLFLLKKYIELKVKMKYCIVPIVLLVISYASFYLGGVFEAALSVCITIAFLGLIFLKIKKNVFREIN